LRSRDLCSPCRHAPHLRHDFVDLITDAAKKNAVITEVELPGVVEPDGLRLWTRKVPRISAGQALVRMEATGVSFAEQRMRRGEYYDQRPFPRARGPVVGQRVAALSKTGGWADRLVADTTGLVPVPAGLGAEEAER
jgi:NADPH:quinone reductase-like Zn-dependent oxidoreductase